MKFLIFPLFLILTLSASGQDLVALTSLNLNISNKENASKTKEDKLFKSSFELLDRIIIMEATANGKKGKYILDTGSPMLIVNKIPEKNITTLGGIASKGAAEIIEINEFLWAGISKKSTTAIAYDLSNLEKALGIQIDGLIGQNIFNEFELLIDVPNRNIQLYKPYRSSFHKKNNYKQKIRFNNKAHLPVITVKINGKKFKFGIDTGSEINVLNKEVSKKLGAILVPDSKPGNYQDVSGTSTNTQTATLSTFEIKNKSFQDFNFFLLDLTELEKESNLQLDGILGHPFLAANVISINYHKQVIYFW